MLQPAQGRLCHLVSQQAWGPGGLTAWPHLHLGASFFAFREPSGTWLEKYYVALWERSSLLCGERCWQKILPPKETFTIFSREKEARKKKSGSEKNKNLWFVIFENNSQESRKITIKMRNVENGKKEGRLPELLDLWRGERPGCSLAGGAAITCQKKRGLLN